MKRINTLERHNADPWYVQMSGTVYGPYESGQMLAFIREGRIVETSLVSQNPDAMFQSAGSSVLFRPMSSVTQVEVEELKAPALIPDTESSVFLVMAEFGSENAMQFLHLLQRLGKAQRIGDSVWLLRAPIQIDDLRNQLAAVLTRQDRLFVLDSFNNKTAWHNIGADMDERIKNMWENK